MISRPAEALLVFDKKRQKIFKKFGTTPFIAAKRRNMRPGASPDEASFLFVVFIAQKLFEIVFYNDAIVWWRIGERILNKTLAIRKEFIEILMEELSKFHEFIWYIINCHILFLSGVIRVCGLDKEADRRFRTVNDHNRNAICIAHLH
jgi:hypothetical protein